MKPIIPNCLALVISGVDTGKTVRAISRHKTGDTIDLPNGKRAFIDHKEQIVGWLCIGNVSAVGSNRQPYPDGNGFALYDERVLMRIDAEGDDDLIEEFAAEAWADVMDEQMKKMKKEGIRRLW